MARYIDAETFENEMYYESFEKDSDMQKWDSGCWIRYKLFKDCLEKQPTAYDVDKVVEQLDKEINQCFVGDCYEDYDEFEAGRINAFREAIMIVKGGAE